MGISAKTLFHFTDFESLKGILKNGFYPRCSPEQLHIFNEDAIAIPMVSFCDIKFSQLGDHIKTYNNYGIGMTKKWGVSKGVNPVFYMENGSQPLELVKPIIMNFFSIMSLQEKIGQPDYLKYNYEIIKLTFQLVMYYKRNNGQRWNKKTKEFIGKKINFYDEREWRYCPPLINNHPKNILPIPFAMRLIQDLNISKKEVADIIADETKYTSTTLDNDDFEIQMKAFNDSGVINPVKFKLNDIKYIIVKNERDIKKLINDMVNEPIYKDNSSLFRSKITTVQSIKADH